jgi:hypothetical protein
MTIEAAPYEIAWLRELERRAAKGLPPDTNEMMVALRGTLPRGFRPTHVNYRLLNNQSLSVEGLLAIGDSEKVVPVIDRTIRYIRDRLIQSPNLAQITATEVSEALNIPVTRAENVLMLASSLGSFMAGASGSTHGYSSITLGRDEVLAEYLGFESTEAALAKRDQPAVRPEVSAELIARDRALSDAPIRHTVFIVMNMDPLDAALVDVHDTIRTACGEFGLTALRIDDIEHQDRITDRILDQISSAEFIVADLSGERPNVYYEVGYAHAIGKHPILVRKTGTRLHFDLSVHNAPEYNNNKALGDILRRRFEAILGRSPSDVRAT